MIDSFKICILGWALSFMKLCLIFIGSHHKFSKRHINKLNFHFWSVQMYRVSQSKVYKEILLWWGYRFGFLLIQEASCITLGKKASGFTRICTRVQSSEMTKFLDNFEDQKIDKMDIIICHDPQIVKCSKWFLLFT